MGSSFIYGRNNHVCGNVSSARLFRQGYTRIQYPIWLRGRVHISVNVLRKLAAKLAPHSAMNVIICPFSILSLTPNQSFVLVIAYIF